MTRPRRFDLCQALIVVGLVAAIFAAAIRPVDAVAPPPSAEPGDARFGELSASPSFPTTILFDLAVEASQEIVRAELLFAPRWVETVNLIEAEIEPGRAVTLTFPLDMYQNYLPPGLDILYRWRVTDAAGRVTESADQVVLWQDTRFDWREIGTEQVSVFFYTENEAFNRRILETAQRTIDELQAELSLDRSRPLRIWVYNARDDFTGSQAPNTESWIVGASYSGYYLILSVIPDGNDYELGRIVPHEVSHQILYQAANNPFNLPARWLDEGIAVRNQDSDTAGYAEVLRAAVEEGRLIPLKGLHRHFPADDSHTLAYAQSLSVVEFIIERWGEDALGDVIDAYRDGISHDEALRRGLGVTVAELDRLWREHLGYQGDRPLEDGTGGPVGLPAAVSGGSAWRIGWPPALAVGLIAPVGALIWLRRGTRTSSENLADPSGTVRSARAPGHRANQEGPP